jgi:hypothetical protein
LKPSEENNPGQRNERRTPGNPSHQVIGTRRRRQVNSDAVYSLALTWINQSVPLELIGRPSAAKRLRDTWALREPARSPRGMTMCGLYL